MSRWRRYAKDASESLKLAAKYSKNKEHEIFFQNLTKLLNSFVSLQQRNKNVVNLTPNEAIRIHARLKLFEQDTE